jgi:hypothetical protein
MICPQCGTSLPDDATLCSLCGRMLAEPAPVYTPPTTTAPSILTAPTSDIPPTSGKAIASLVFGLLPLSLLSSIPAVVLGHLALSEIRKSGGRLQGRGMAIAGLVLGYLGFAVIPIIGLLVAVSIPNLRHAREAANEATAIAGLRTINTAEFAYRSDYPLTGFARDLASLGPDGSSSCAKPTPERACLIDYRLSLAGSRPGRNGYMFDLQGSEDGHSYFVTAVPLVRSRSGSRSFCSLEDRDIRVSGSGGSIPDRQTCGALPPLSRVQSESE